MFSLFNNSGKTAIVTGGGAGIGLAVAEALAESGANVAIWYHSNKKAIDRAAEIEEEYGVKCAYWTQLLHSHERKDALGFTELTSTLILAKKAELTCPTSAARIPCRSWWINAFTTLTAV